MNRHMYVFSRGGSWYSDINTIMDNPAIKFGILAFAHDGIGINVGFRIVRSFE